MTTTTWNKILIFLLVVLLTYNLSAVSQRNNQTENMQKRNHTGLLGVATGGNNIAKYLQKILQPEPNVPFEELTDSWRIIMGQSQSNSYHWARFDPHVMGDLSNRWHLWQAGLSRIEGLFLELNTSFLQQGSYDLNVEQRMKLEAVVAIYSSLFQAFEEDREHPELVIDELHPQMTIIDPDSYPRMLEMLDDQ
ncbi:hypothetical protein [Paenibacillus daejeonensis]|uniref:hypothetical protein n=1 Tax=Paenibacillus daejeonensis TaxID=135193 RepID=UPI0003610E4D|nr:hypothetical protein [Paenibacillus daejeonensis]